MEGETDVHAKFLGASEASTYRGFAARANYLAQDRADVQFAVKEIARRMTRPREEDWGLLKRLARYLRGSPRAAWKFCWQSEPTCTSTPTGPAAKRRAEARVVGPRRTGGTRSKRGPQPRPQWRGPAENRSSTATRNGRVHTDASATIGIISRQGLGRLRHINVQYLWLQER